jgi:hypothetical protein
MPDRAIYFLAIEVCNATRAFSKQKMGKDMCRRIERNGGICPSPSHFDIEAVLVLILAYFCNDNGVLHTEYTMNILKL